MSCQSYGVNTYNSSEERSKERISLGNQKEAVQNEKYFRGFKKSPLVLLPRMNFSCINEDGKIPMWQVRSTKELQDHCKHLSKFKSKCAVKIVRDDLESLRQAFLHGSPRSYATSSEADSSMANLKCKICDKLYSSVKRLQNHQENKHMIMKCKTPKRVSFNDNVIIHEVKEYHKCRKCTKIFEDYSTLKLHMKLKHKKRKCYICNYCNKSFMDRMFFKVHIKLHCDVCGELFTTKKKFMEHKRFVCKVIKMHKCNTCNCSFFKFMDLKDHNYEHLSTFFICDICKDQFSTKCEITHHIAFLHSAKRPRVLYFMRNIGTERVYLCNFCDESSVDRDYIEHHLESLPDLSNKAMTGYKDYYFCDQCLKKFDTEKNMLKHKWTHFLKTSDNSQKRIYHKAITKKPKVQKFKLTEKLPDHIRQPKIFVEKMPISVVAEKLKVPDIEETNKANGFKNNDDSKNIDLIKSFDAVTQENNVTHDRDDFGQTTTKVAVEPKVKKRRETLLSKHKCETCGKFYSTNYCLNRHIETQHCDYENLRCNVCEEVFVWPSLLRSHKCIRLNLPEMPFDDARPEIHFDNLHQIENGFDNFNIVEEDDYRVDFEIPAPIVDLTEGTCNDLNSEYVYSGNSSQNKSIMGDFKNGTIHTAGYKLVMQEVPIEF